MDINKLFVGDIYKCTGGTIIEHFVMDKEGCASIEQELYKKAALLIKTKYYFVDIDNLNLFEILLIYLSENKNTKYLNNKFDQKFMRRHPSREGELFVNRKSVTPYLDHIDSDSNNVSIRSLQKSRQRKQEI